MNDLASVDHSADAAARKAQETVRAEAAMAGLCLYALAKGGWLVSRVGMARELPDLQGVRELLQRMNES